jgi:hypothetical protein
MAAAVVTFERAVEAVIIANVGVVIAGLVIDGHEQLFETAHCARRRPGCACWC